MITNFSENRFTFKAESFVGTATASSDTVLWHKITGTNRVMTGVNLIYQGAAMGDYVSFQLADKDGLVYPAGTVVITYAAQWYLRPGTDMLSVFPGYVSGILPTNFYVKMMYHSVGATDVPLACNLYWHEMK